MQPVFVDIETQSSVDLTTKGARVYIADSSTRLMSLVAKTRKLTYVWVPHCRYELSLQGVDLLSRGEQVPAWLREMEAGYLWVGHNAYSFDGVFLRHHYQLNPRWYDTIHPARASGFSGSLDQIGEQLGMGGKDKSGEKIMRMLCVAKPDPRDVTRTIYTPGTQHMWEELVRYNIQDVLITEAIYDIVNGREEPEVVRVDRAINERGIYVDQQWLTTLLQVWDRVEERGGDRLATLTGGALSRENAGSVSQVKRWLVLQGVRVESLDKRALAALYADPEDFIEDCDDEKAHLVVEVLKLRQQLTRAMKGKLQRIAGVVHGTDGRIRDWSVYWGAHTGRFTSRGIQLHNLSKGAPIDTQAVLTAGDRVEEVLQTEIERTGCDPDAALSALVRPVFRASPGFTLGIVDYSAVEARGVAWLAGEETLLRAFLDPGRDVYCDFASIVFGRPCTKKDKRERDVAKICILGMGYGMSANKFAIYAKQSGINLDALSLTAEGLVKQYRDTYPKIRATWREVGDAAEKAVRFGGDWTCCGGKVRFDYDGHDLRLTLPSLRQLTYRCARIELRVPGYALALGLPTLQKPTVVYTTPHGYDSVLYGAKLTENIVQAFCRDFLTDALVMIEDHKDGIAKPILHVHDEIASQIPEEFEELGLHRMCEIMSVPQEWAPDFPLRVEGFTSPHYVKGAWKGQLEVDYMNGKCLKATVRE